MIEVTQLSKFFKNGDSNLIAINNANFKINKGEVVVVMGPSGSGKTTLVSMLGGLSRPSSGSIKISNCDINTLSHTEMAKFRLKNFGYVFQNFKLLKSLTVVENVMIPLCCIGNHAHKKALEAAKEILTTLDMQDRFDFSIEKLSGGEKQRVAIARALINNPVLILADEPTASLDSKTGKIVSQLLRDIAKKDNRTVVIVSHDPRIMPIADRIFKVEDGFVREDAI